MEYETAGDPMSGLKWTRKSTEKIAEELGKMGMAVSPNTVGRLLKDMEFSLRVNNKKISFGSGPDRDKQFDYITKLRKKFARQGALIVSVDTKKKELVGNFKNPGRAWGQQATSVNDHDFRSQASGIAIPYGIYDVLSNCGSVFVGTSSETSEFAVSCIVKWWFYDARYWHSDPSKLLILADNGGCNGSNGRAWKYWLQKKLCSRHGLTVTVCHYPPGSSKWNPIEHRFFSEISKNWAGRPLDSYETILNYIETTETCTGLRVKAYLDTKTYKKGLKISDEQMSEVRIKRHVTLPQWNYTIRPS
jgi:hypothetical protein